MVKMSQLMRECWNAKPAARLTMLRVKKTLASLIENNESSTNSSSDKYGEIVYKNVWRQEGGRARGKTEGYECGERLGRGEAEGGGETEEGEGERLREDRERDEAKGERGGETGEDRERNKAKGEHEGETEGGHGCGGERLKL